MLFGDTMERFLPNKQERNAFIAAVVLGVVALIIEIVVLAVGADDGTTRARAWMLIVFGVVSPVVGLLAWNRYVPRYAPRIVKFLTTNFFGRRLVGGGSFAYYEDKPPSEAESYIKPIFRLLSLLIAYLGLAVTVLKLLGMVVDIEPQSPAESWTFFVIWYFLMIFIPLALTPIIPVVWSLEDAGVKIWFKPNKTNWLVSQRYQSRFNGLIAFGAVAAGLGLSEGEGFSDTVSFFFDLLTSSILVLLVPNTLIIVAYYAYFRKILIKMTKESVDLPVYETKLVTLGDESEAAETDDIEEVAAFVGIESPDESLADKTDELSDETEEDTVTSEADDTKAEEVKDAADEAEEVTEDE